MKSGLTEIQSHSPQMLSCFFHSIAQSRPFNHQNFNLPGHWSPLFSFYCPRLATSKVPTEPWWAPSDTVFSFHSPKTGFSRGWRREAKGALHGRAVTRRPTSYRTYRRRALSSPGLVIQSGTFSQTSSSLRCRFLWGTCFSLIQQIALRIPSLSDRPQRVWIRNENEVRLASFPRAPKPHVKLDKCVQSSWTFCEEQ